MFGIKTRLIGSLKRRAFWLTRGRLTSDKAIRFLMEYFVADEIGHRTNYNKADLGYGFLHYGFVRTLKPLKILCIGSRYGFIPAVLAQACKDNHIGHVDFVDAGYGPEDKDHWTGVGYWKTKRGKGCFKNFDLARYITLYVMRSYDFAMRFRKRFYDYIYIDGNHSYKGVSLDYRLFWPKLNNYGFMIFHDVNVRGRKREGEYGVYKLWQEISKDKSCFIIPSKGPGLGVIQKRPKDEN